MGITWLVTGLLTALAFVALAPRLRRRAARWAHDRLRRTSRRKREARLRDDDAPVLELPELTQLVDGCIRCGARDPFELDALLDRYAELALARHRCGQLLARADLDVLESRLANARVAHPLSAAMIERRIAHTAELGRLGRHLDESLAEVGDLVRYYAERDSLPDVEALLDDGPVTLTLDRLDASAAAEVL